MDPSCIALTCVEPGRAHTPRRVSKTPSLMDDLDLEAFAQELVRAEAGIWANYGEAGPLTTLEFIKRELRAPYAEVRRRFESPNAAEQFALLTGETPATLKEGKLVQVCARRFPLAPLRALGSGGVLDWWCVRLGAPNPCRFTTTHGGSLRLSRCRPPPRPPAACHLEPRSRAPRRATAQRRLQAVIAMACAADRSPLPAGSVPLATAANPGVDVLCAVDAVCMWMALRPVTTEFSGFLRYSIMRRTLLIVTHSEAQAPTASPHSLMCATRRHHPTLTAGR
jgi:hypothetical protein